MTAAGRRPEPSSLALVGGFATLYLVWGSTYLAIRIAIETLPPFWMAGARYLVAGGVLYLWARWRGAPRASRRQVAAAVVVGALLLLGGNGGVVWAEQRVASGLAALLVSTVPLWVVVLSALGVGGGGRRRPTVPVLSGVAGGLGGVGLLMTPGELLGGSGVDQVGAVVLVAASLSWAGVSIATRLSSMLTCAGTRRLSRRNENGLISGDGDGPWVPAAVDWMRGNRRRDGLPRPPRRALRHDGRDGHALPPRRHRPIAASSAALRQLARGELCPSPGPAAIHAAQDARC